MRKRTSGHRDLRITSQKCRSSGTSHTRTIHKYPVCCPQKRRRDAACNKSQRGESVSELPPFQNGRHSLASRPVTTKRLVGENRPEGRLFCSPYMGKSPEIPAIPLERVSNGVCMPAIRPSICTQDIYKTNETCSCASSPIGHTSNHLLGRYFAHESNTSGAPQGHFDSTSFAGKLRFCNKHDQVSVESNSDARVSGISGEYPRHDPCSPPGESDCNQKSLHSDDVPESGHSSRLSSTNREIDSLNTSYFSSPSSLSTVTELEKQSSSIRGNVRHTNQSQSNLQRGTSLVESTFGCLEWPGHIYTPTRSSDRNGCIKTGLGGNLPEHQNRGPLVTERTSSTHQLPGTTSRGVCCEIFHQEPDLFACSTPNGQHHCHCLHKQTWRNSFLSTIQPCGRSLDLGAQQGHDTQCRTSAREMECSSRSGVETISRLQRLAFRTISISSPNEDTGPFPNRPFCQQTECPTSRFFQLEARSTGTSFRCLSAEVEHRETLCLSSILSDHENSSQVEGRRRQSHTGYTSLANSTLVPSTTRHVSSPTSASSPDTQPLDQPSRGHTPSNTEQIPISGRMACIQRSAATRGISDRASKLILASWRPGTNAVYNSAWSKWSSWCKEGEVDPLCPTVGNITEFLCDSFDIGLQYRTINTYRSALSSVIPPIEGFPVGQHPLVVRLMKGIQNSRPAMPRYQHCWDINKVLEYVKSLPANEDLSLGVLTKKLATLMAITAPKRSSELALLDLNFAKTLPEGITFQLPGMTKTSSEIRTVFFASFPDTKAVCVTTTLKAYLYRTTQAREHLSSKPGASNPLFLSYHRPYKPVKSCSIGRWIKKFIGSAGIDTNIFKAHSTRSASTTKAKNKGVSISEIQDMADWSSTSSIFRRFYYKPLLNSTYAQAVLSSG